MDWDNFYDFHGGFGFWGFIVAIVLIGSIFSYLKQKSRNDLIREAMRNGQEIDPEIMKNLDTEEDKGGLIMGGAITMAAAVGLLFLGYQIEKVEGDQETFEIMKGVAAIPGMIGLVLFIAGIISKMSGNKKS